MTFNVFADNWLFVMTSNIVPFDSISIKVVKYGKTGLFSTVLLDIFSVIGLGSWWAESVNDNNKNKYTLFDILNLNLNYQVIKQYQVESYPSV